MTGTYWKVLIADDEPIIREGIRDCVDWHSLHMKVIAEAEDGEEAFALAMKHQIDILLVDLNMPIMNGLTLIKQLKEQLPHCQVVIITGYDEFAYAQEAIRLQVTDYILKPVEPEQLLKVLQALQTELDESVSQTEYLQLASQQIAKNMSQIVEKLGREWIDDRLDKEEIERQLMFLNLPIEMPKQVAMFQCPEYFAKKPLMNEKDRKAMLDLIRKRIASNLDSTTYMLFQDDEELFVVIVWQSISEEKWCLIENELQSVNIAAHAVVREIAAEGNTVSSAYHACKAELNHEVAISPLVRRAQQYIMAHFTDSSITLELVAQHLKVSPVYLSRLMKQELGVSFVHHVTNMRIKKSIELLHDTNMPIVEIAEKVGYDTQHYFSTSFKKVMGVSPIKYRKKIW